MSFIKTRHPISLKALSLFIFTLCIFSFLSSPLFAQTPICSDLFRPGKPEKTIPAHLAKPCTFENLELPPDFVVYAAGNYDGIKLPFQVNEDSASPVTEMQVYVNVKEKPVILMLGNYDTTIFQIYRTPQTKIIAVYGSGHYPPVIAGLSPQTPVFIPKAPTSCNKFYLSQYNGKINKDTALINGISQQLFDQPVEDIILSQTDWAVYIGEQLDRSEYIQDRKQSAESFRMPNTPLAGKAGIQDALRDGLIMPAKPADIKAWYQISKYPSDYHYGDLSKESVQKNLAKNAYIIVKPFRIPVGLNGSSAVLFIRSQGVPWPQGILGQSELMDMNDGLCWGSQNSDGALRTCAINHYKQYAMECNREWRGLKTSISSY